MVILRSLAFIKLCWLWLWYQSWGPFYLYQLTLIPAWISNHGHCKMWGEILIHCQTSMVVPLKFGNGWINLFHTFDNGCNHLSMLGLKLNHVSKRDPWWVLTPIDMDVRWSYSHNKVPLLTRYSIYKDFGGMLFFHCSITTHDIINCFWWFGNYFEPSHHLVINGVSFVSLNLKVDSTFAIVYEKNYTDHVRLL